MASLIRNRINQLEALKKQIPRQAELIAERLQSEIISFITERQLFDKGIDGKGKRLKPYSPLTITIKKQKGKVFNRTTLLDQGDFHKGFFLFAKGGFMFFSSKDFKTPELIEKYGEDIFVLTVENNKIVNQERILPELVKWFLSRLKI